MVDGVKYNPELVLCPHCGCIICARCLIYDERLNEFQKEVAGERFHAMVRRFEKHQKEVSHEDVEAHR